MPLNGTPAPELGALDWIKSKHSARSVNCVELATLPDGGYAMRNSTDPTGPALIFTHPEMVAFFAGARDGQFDSLLTR